MGLPLHYFSGIQGMDTRPAIYKKTPHEDLKCTKLCLGPIQTCSEAFLGFLGKTEMKAYPKLTVVMCCQIVARKSVAPSSGNFRQRPALRYACSHDQEF
jgi:hypothetical protein